MNLKTFEAETMGRALALVKREMGPEAVILRTRTFRRGGLLRLGSRDRVQITASMRAASVSDRSVIVSGRAVNPRPGQDHADHSVNALRHANDVCHHEHRADRALTLPALSNPEPAMDELRQIRQMVHRMMRLQVTQPRPDLSDALFNQYLGLLEQEVSEELADEVVQKVRRQLGEPELADPQMVRQATRSALADLIPACPDTQPPVSQADGHPRVIALVGPTGVGKTTTIAKLAAHYHLRQRKRVALVTIDTYRIAAVDQLRTYAQIIDVPLHVAAKPSELAVAIHSCRDRDVVLIDTAGRGQRDDARLDELGAFLDAASPHEVHLVLSCAASQGVLMEAAERFGRLRIDRVLFTKLDEAVNFGVLVNVARKVRKRLSYVTMGQDVPYHIEPGDPRRLAGLILGEKL